MKILGSFVAVAGFLLAFSLVEVRVDAAPLHASCKLTWTVSLSCSNVSTLLVNQMKVWNMSSESLCTKSGTEKCLYDLKTNSATEIKATHTTPVKHYVDDLTFTLTGSGSSCSIQGFSTSETWYAVLDSGTNYCNMRNLADGSGLSRAKGFKEDVSNSICTQYSSHNCDKY